MRAGAAATADRVIRVGDHTIIVSELSVAEVRSWFVDLDSNQARDPLQALVFEDCGLDDLARMCDMPVEQLEEFTPSELAGVLQAARELNPFFFRVRRALNAATRQLVQAATWSTESIDTSSG